MMTREKRHLGDGSFGLRWKQIAARLREDIERQRLRAGEQVMTELDLAHRFSVSRSTVRRALAELSKEGLIRIEHGRGTFVAEDLIHYAIGERTRWTESMEHTHLQWRRTILGSSIEEADSDVRRNLDLRHGAGVICIDVATEVDGRRMCVGRSYYPAERFPGIDDLLQQDSSPTKAFNVIISTLA